MRNKGELSNAMRATMAAYVAGVIGLCIVLTVAMFINSIVGGIAFLFVGVPFTLLAFYILGMAALLLISAVVGLFRAVR